MLILKRTVREKERGEGGKNKNEKRGRGCVGRQSEGLGGVVCVYKIGLK